MYLARYLLDIEEFMDAENGEALFARAFLCVDEERREKAARMRLGRVRAASLGAGLLLQAAVGEASAACGAEVSGRKVAGRFGKVTAIAACGAEVSGRPGHTPEHRRSGETDMGDAPGIGREGTPSGAAGMADLKRYSVNQLLESLHGKPPVPLAYVYGKAGKPYFKDLPFYFNLSHSGDYVLCAFSSEEIGIDIQQHCGKDVERLAKRFFSGREVAALKQAEGEREKLFYSLWARKEAYGKLTGKGIAETLAVDCLQGKAVFPGCGGNPRETYAPPGEDFPEGGMALQGMASCRAGAWMSQTMVMPDGKRLLWEEYGGIEGYSIALCRYVCGPYSS